MLDTFNGPALKDEYEFIQWARTYLRKFLRDLHIALKEKLLTPSDWLYVAEQSDALTLQQLENMTNGALGQLNAEQISHFGGFIEEKLDIRNFRYREEWPAPPDKFVVVNKDRMIPDQMILGGGRLRSPSPAQVYRPTVESDYAPKSRAVSNGTQVMYALGLVFLVWAIGEVGSR